MLPITSTLTPQQLELFVKTVFIILLHAEHFTVRFLSDHFIDLGQCVLEVTNNNKNSSGDEIANVNFYAVRPEATRIR